MNDPGARGLDGIGRQDGPLRDDYGPGWANLRCDQCSAGWVGEIGMPCPWCEDNRMRLLEHQRELDRRNGRPLRLVADIGDDWPTPTPLYDAHDRPAFPVDALPDWVAAQVRQVADEMQFPDDLPAMLAITGLSIACAGHARLTVRGTWKEQLSTYLVTAMGPGNNKSPAFKQMLGCLDEWEAELVEQGASERDMVEVKRSILDKERTKHINAGDAAKAAAVSDELRALPDTTEPRLMADDATPEKVVDMLREQGGRLALVSTEGGLFDLMTGRYSDRANLDVYLQAWSGDTIRVDRIGRPSSVVRNPHLTIGLLVQPSVVGRLADHPELHGRGLLARFMYSLPEDRVGMRDMHREPAIDELVAGHYRRSLIELARRMHGLGNVELALTPEALHLFHTWRQDLEERRRPGGDLERMVEWTIKLESTVARLAGLLALAEGCQPDAAIMERAIEVGRYWEAHARIAHDLWGGDQVVARAGKLIDWMIAQGVTEVSLRDVYAKANRRITPEDAVDVVRLLVDSGWLRPADDYPLVVGRRGVPSPTFTLNPISSHVRNTRARMRAMHLKTNSDDSLSLSSEGGGCVNSAHGAHDAHDHPQVTPTGEVVPEPSEPVDNPPSDPDRFPDEELL